MYHEGGDGGACAGPCRQHQRALARAFVRGLALGTFSGPRTFTETRNSIVARVGVRVSVAVPSRHLGSLAREGAA